LFCLKSLKSFVTFDCNNQQPSNVHIAYDAKRVFHNRSGLGNYSRNLLLALTTYYPDNTYSLFTPKVGTDSKLWDPRLLPAYTPSGLWKQVPSLWRSKGMVHQLKRVAPDIYHGLSHELPDGIQRTKIKSIVTVHDLIFIRYPEWYSFIDRKLYEVKYRHACKIADRIVAIGEQTSDDLQAFWNIDKAKIEVIKQGCNPLFWNSISDEQCQNVRETYSIPRDFILQVGTIEPRKNHLTTLKALAMCKNDLPLVIVSRLTKFKEELIRFISKNGLDRRVIFLHDVPNEALPALYKMAFVSVYPSIFEGFGIPVLESIVCGTPVITSAVTCFKDAGGDAALYFDPNRPDGLASLIDRLTNGQALYNELLEKGEQHKQSFTQEQFALNTINLYKKVMR
jgi:glycosyltransferase involved in cell wall biosynthesis